MSRGHISLSPAASSSSSSQQSTQFIPGANDDEELYDVLEILAEKGRKYKVRWAGEDPKTKKPWEPTWVYKHDCTDKLIREWKKKKAAKKTAKATGRKSKARSSVATVQTATRSGSISTTATTRKSRPSAKEPTPATADRPTARASSSRVGPLETIPSKRRATTRDPVEDDNSDPPEAPSRPRKRRKVEVEIVTSPIPHSPSRSESGQTAAPRRSNGKRSVSVIEEANEDVEDAPIQPHSGPHHKASSKGKAKATDENQLEDLPVAVPLSKVGPPRRPKRSLQSMSTSSNRHGSDKPPSSSRKVPSNGSSSRSRGKESTDRAPRTNGHATNHLRSSRPLPVLDDLEEDSASDEEELLDPSFLKVLKRARTSSVPVSPKTRRLLAQEEEESTQDAANWLPPPASPAIPQTESSKSPARDVRPRTNGNAGPSKPNGTIALQGRTSANDTFSRDGIVPETQPNAASTRSDNPRRHTSPHDDPVVDRSPPRTPHTKGGRQPSASKTASSVKSKMKPRRTSSKELRPVPSISPSVFHPHLPSVADEDEIEEFSSPEKDTRKKKRSRLDLPTQDTIEEGDFTQEPMDAFVDWDGGAQLAEDPFTADDDDDSGLALSLGPELPSPNSKGGPRQAMSSLLSKQSAPGQEQATQVTASPEVTALQELPSTSTTQRADVDSQSQTALHSQIAELNAALEEKEEQLSQVELQVEELQSRITELEAEKAQDVATYKAELAALQEASDDKTEQISQLEVQLVELQLQLTHQTSEAYNLREQHEKQVLELNESLEERNEQVSQLETALVELQDEITAVAAENERLAAAQQQSTEQSTDDMHSRHTEQLAAAEQRAAGLQAELTDVRERLSAAEQDSFSLGERLEKITQDWERRLKYVEDDRDLFKTLYSEASSHAARLATENAALEARATLAEGQVRDGLAMVRGTFEERVRTLQEEAERWRAQYALLSTRDARTDDDVRRRAALEPGVREENARLRAEAEEVRADMEKMAGIIAQMTGQRTGSDGSGDGDVDVDAGVADAHGAADEGGDAGEEDSFPWHGKAYGSVAGGFSGSPPRAFQSSESVEESEGRVVFVCQAVEDARVCSEQFDTPQEVIQHARKTHYADVYNEACP
ncbi:hypothetical protein C2E23DRAFT_718932 [Lenzites betulinus]|nr:hypothetical protein C2E23DRAFT_718932 [Lenzites betulinus]